ncbi:MAG: glycosyltransferase family 61 protein [Bacteroidota bacterium]|nr:glycosyltransferase family 61 protein [Bacteroidota bacterium]
MSKFKLYKKKIKNLFFGTIKPVKAKDEATDEQIIFPEGKFHMPEFKDAFNCSHIGFSGYDINTPPLYVRSFNNAFCFTNREEVFSENKQVILEFTTQKKNPRIGESKLIFRRSKKRKIDAVVAHLSLSGLENNYYHFLTECLARFYLLEKSSYKPEFYIISNHMNFQMEMLNLLGITADRIIPANSNFLLQIKTLIVPDFINNWDKVHYRGFEGYQKLWAPSWIVNVYHDKINLLKSNKPGTRKIYISRDKANHRKLVNENEVNLLFSELGFEIYYLEEMNMLQQIDLFASAGFVAGLHGAGFANLYFSNSKTKIFEIYTEHYHDASYRILATSLGLNYSYIIGQTVTTKDTHPQKEDVEVGVEQLKHALVKFINV